MAETVAAPPAAPAAPAAPAPAPINPANGAPAKDTADAYAQLDAMAEPPPNPPAPTSKRQAPEKTQTPKPESKPEDHTPEDQQPSDDKAKPEPVKAGTLRQNYDRLKADFAAAQERLKQYEAERAKPPTDHPEFKKVAETLTQKEKRLAELEDEIRYTNYEKSTEYQETYWKPFAKAFADARAEMENLDVAQPDGSTRPATAADFDEIAGLDYRSAKAKAQEKFGDDWQTVMNLRKTVTEKNNARAEALDKFRTEGAEREKQQREAAAKFAQERAAKWEAENKAAVERFPKLFKPVEGDEKGNALLARGFELADAAFGAPLKDPATGLPVKLTPEEALKLHSAIRNKAGGFDRLAHLYSLGQKRIAELEAKLKDFEESEPSGAGTRARKPEDIQGGGSFLDRADQELAKLAGS